MKLFGRATNVAAQSMSQTFKFPEAYDLNFLAVPKKYLTGYTLQQYREQLVITSKYDEEKSVAMYGEDENNFYFPRYFFKDRLNIIGKLHDSTNKGDPISFTMHTTLWDYQQKAISEFISHVGCGKTGFFLGAAPGAGKTQIGIKMLEILGRTAMIIVPKKDLVDQWVERILKTTDLTKADIGICQNGALNWQNKKVVVGVVHTVAKFTNFPEFQRNFGVVLFDECDSSVPPETFAPAATMFTAKYRIGMTASETRADGLHKVFQNHISEVQIFCEKSNTMVPEVVFINYRKSSGELPPSKSRIRLKGMLLNLLARNQDRNYFIAEYTKLAAVDENRPTVVMSDRISQLKDIHQILVNKFQIPKDKIGFYYGPNNKVENKRVADTCQIILATYGFMSRGTDVPRLSCIIFATYRNELTQIVGRIERAYPNKKTPLVIDFVDPSYSVCNLSREERLKYYFSRNLNVYEK